MRAALAKQTADGPAVERRPGCMEIAKVRTELASAFVTPTGPNLSAADQAEAERRFSAIEPLISPQKFRTLWLECRNRKGLVLQRIALLHNVKRSTVYNWLKSWKDGGLSALVRKDRLDKGKHRVLNQEALIFVLAVAMPKRGPRRDAYGVYSVKEIYRAYSEERVWRERHFGKRLSEPDSIKYERFLDESGYLSDTKGRLPEASYSTFRRWFENIPQTLRTMGRSGEEAFSSTQEIISFRDLGALMPLDYVVMDHRQLDVFCMVKDKSGWRLARPWLTAAIDMRTRKWLAWAVVESPSSDSIATVLKKIFVEFGAPQAVYWDNGKDFRCEWLEGGNSRATDPRGLNELHNGFRGVLETMGVRVHHAIVRRARAKIIEPNFGNTAMFDRTLPTWCGHKPTQRPKGFADLVDRHERWSKGELSESPFQTIQQIAWLYDEFLQSLNEREHTGEGMRKVTPTGMGWRCPNECWELLIGRVQKRVVPPETLQFCFRKRRKSTVRNGEVKATFSGTPCHYRMTDDPAALMALNGRTVEISFDPYDLGAVAVYYEGRFVGLAKNVELRNMGENSFVEDERIRRASRRDAKQLISAIHRAVPIASAEERALRRMEVAPERREPQRAIAACTLPEGISAAAEAAQRDRLIAPIEPSQIEVVQASQTEDEDDAFNFFK